MAVIGVEVDEIREVQARPEWPPARGRHGPSPRCRSRYKWPARFRARRRGPDLADGDNADTCGQGAVQEGLARGRQRVVVTIRRALNAPGWPTRPRYHAADTQTFADKPVCDSQPGTTPEPAPIASCAAIWKSCRQRCRQSGRRCAYVPAQDRRYRVPDAATLPMTARPVRRENWRSMSAGKPSEKTKGRSSTIPIISQYR